MAEKFASEETRFDVNTAPLDGCAATQNPRDDEMDFLFPRVRDSELKKSAPGIPDASGSNAEKVQVALRQVDGASAPQTDENRGTYHVYSKAQRGRHIKKLAKPSGDKTRPTLHLSTSKPTTIEAVVILWSDGVAHKANKGKHTFEALRRLRKDKASTRTGVDFYAEVDAKVQKLFETVMQANGFRVLQLCGTSTKPTNVVNDDDDDDDQDAYPQEVVHQAAPHEGAFAHEDYADALSKPTTSDGGPSTDAYPMRTAVVRCDRNGCWRNDPYRVIVVSKQPELSA